MDTDKTTDKTTDKRLSVGSDQIISDDLEYLIRVATKTTKIPFEVRKMRVGEVIAVRAEILRIQQILNTIWAVTNI